MSLPYFRELYTMKQYEFKAVNRKRGNIEHIRATAINETEAREAILDYYDDQFVISESCCAVNPPHSVLGEIDCS